ncbi:histidinol-phosphate aminotransferase [Streptomyces achromogenes]|uniref:Rv2231c family pyridoxal phosphate-dependent protein CobC n=1 Tax=Streptomyces achromogenes TaxID=67255 RepID=UPI002787D536|nr:Rv2231c family pyridoxal phosphate-dependent protein CobC [Streptomyces achromogenes]MDQ0830156.1 histidinol-phosphate aminotransferase [Streptomyces achromogenes]
MTDAAAAPAHAPVPSGSPAAAPATSDAVDACPETHGSVGGDGVAFLVVGVGASTGVPAAEVVELVENAVREAGRSVRDLAELATVDVRAGEPGLVEAARRLGVPVVTYSARQLAGVRVPHPSDAPFAALGTASVAEAAALIGGGELVVPKRRSAGTPARATCAVARRPGRPGLPGAPAESAHAESAAAPPDDVAATSASRTDIPHPGITLTDRETRTPMHTDGQADEHADGRGGVPDPTHDLRHHGDAETRDDGSALVDLAVNVRADTPPRWLLERVAASLGGLAAYPDGRAARAAVAARHGLPVERVLLTAGAAEAFVLLARALRVRRPVVVHPQFTEPEAALRDAGHHVGRVLLRARDGFRLDPAAVPDDADLVVIGNPTNPTSVLHPADTIRRLARAGRTLVVDEAFMDAVPGEREALAGRADVPGLVVLRSLTKTWGLAGLRIGYVLAAPETIAELERAQPLWPVSTPALAAAQACVEPQALAEAGHAAHRIAADRAHLVAGLEEFASDGLRVAGPAQGPFVLVRLPRAAAVRRQLRVLGFAVRRGDTFPGLDEEWLRLAVRDRVTVNRFLQALDQALALTRG